MLRYSIFSSEMWHNFLHICPVLHAHARWSAGYYSGLDTCKDSSYQELQDGDFKFKIHGTEDFHNANLYKSTIYGKQAEFQTSPE